MNLKQCLKRSNSRFISAIWLNLMIFLDFIARYCFIFPLLIIRRLVSDFFWLYPHWLSLHWNPASCRLCLVDDRLYKFIQSLLWKKFVISRVSWKSFNSKQWDSLCHSLCSTDCQCTGKARTASVIQYQKFGEIFFFLWQSSLQALKQSICWSSAAPVRLDKRLFSAALINSVHSACLFRQPAEIQIKYFVSFTFDIRSLSSLMQFKYHQSKHQMLTFNQSTTNANLILIEIELWLVT